MKTRIKNITARRNMKQTEQSPKPENHRSFESRVFDFDSHWNLIKPHLDDPKLKATLKRTMENYFAHRARLCGELGLNPKNWQVEYDPMIGPWQYHGNLGGSGSGPTYH
jgi:hypothetical protein